MENFPESLQPKRPHETLKDAVLGPARRELLRLEAAVSFIDRVWSSKAFWATAAAVLVICVSLNLFHSAAPVSMLARKPVQLPSPFAVELAESLGDGPVLEVRIARQLAGTFNALRMLPSARLEELRRLPWES